MLNSKQIQLCCLLTEAIRLLCRRSLDFNSICVEGLLGVTVDKKDVFLVNINEMLEDASKDKFQASPELLNVVTRGAHSYCESSDVTEETSEEASSADKTMPVRVFPAKSPLVRHRVPVVLRGRGRRRGLPQKGGATFGPVPGLPKVPGPPLKRRAPDSSCDFSDQDGDSDPEAEVKIVKKERLDTVVDEEVVLNRKPSVQPVGTSTEFDLLCPEESRLSTEPGDANENDDEDDDSMRTLIIKPDEELYHQNNHPMGINLNELSAISCVNSEFGFRLDDSGEQFQPIVSHTGQAPGPSHIPSIPDTQPKALSSDRMTLYQGCIPQHAQRPSESGITNKQTCMPVRLPDTGCSLQSVAGAVGGDPHGIIPGQANAPHAVTVPPQAMGSTASVNSGRAPVKPEIARLQPLIADLANPHRYKDALGQWQILLESITAAEKLPAAGTVRANFLLGRLVDHMFSKQELAACREPQQGSQHNNSVSGLNQLKVAALHDFVSKECHKKGWNLLDPEEFESVLASAVNSANTLNTRSQGKGQSDLMWKVM